jgi:hypothetical protein
MQISPVLSLKYHAFHRDGKLLSIENFQGDGHITLFWTQTTRTKSEYILQSQTGCLAIFIFHPGDAPYAIAELPDERIFFKHTKYPLPKATLSKNRSIGTLASFEPEFHNGGKLAFENGHQFIWTPPAPGENKSSFLNLNGIHLVDFYRTYGFLSTGATVHIHQIARKHPQLPYLILMGWFLNLIK